MPGGGDSSMKCPDVCLGSENVPIMNDTYIDTHIEGIPVLKGSSSHFIPMSSYTILNRNSHPY